MSDVFKEVDEDLRRDQLKTIWDRFGAYIIAVAVLIVVATAGYRLWEYWQGQKAQRDGDRFIEALAATDAGRISEAISGYEAIAADGGAYGALARIQAAIAKSQSGLPGAAASELDAVAADPAVPAALRDVARLRAGLLVVDVADFASMKARLEPLAAVGAPFRHSARELLGLSAWRNGDIETARGYFEQISADTGVPQALASRADMMLALIRARTDQATIAEPAPAPALPTELPGFALPGGQPITVGPLAPFGQATPTTPAPSSNPFAPSPFAPSTAPSPFAPSAAPSPFAPFAPTPEPTPAPIPSPAAEAPPAQPAPAAEAVAPAPAAEPVAPAVEPTPAPVPPPAATPAPAP